MTIKGNRQGSCHIDDTVMSSDISFLLKKKMPYNSDIYKPISFKFGHNHSCYRPFRTSGLQFARGHEGVTGVKSSFLQKKFQLH